MAEQNALFDALRQFMDPGDDLGYQEVLDALKVRGFDTRGIGLMLEPLRFRHNAGEWRGSEFVVYRVPTFDYEVEGDWTEGELRVVRRGERDE